MAAGRMAVLQDPTGAVVCAWQPGANIGARIVNEPGTMSWCELATTDPDKAGPFLSQLFGWRLKGGSDYTEFHRGDTAVGGMMAIPPEWGDVPSHWLTYFTVTDCEATTAQRSAWGPRCGSPPSTSPTSGGSPSSWTLRGRSSPSSVWTSRPERNR